MVNAKILIVDDSLTTRRIIKNTLRSVGFEDVIEAQDGLDALEKLKVTSVDLMLVDWNMPKMSGIDLVKIIRSKDELKGIPVVMVTTEVAKPDVVEALKQGVNDYIFKPFTPEILKEKVQKVLGR